MVIAWTTAFLNNPSLKEWAVSSWHVAMRTGGAPAGSLFSRISSLLTFFPSDPSMHAERMCPEITDLDLQSVMAQIGVADPVELIQDGPPTQEEAAGPTPEEGEKKSEDDDEESSSSDDEAQPSQALIRRVALGLRGH